MSYILDALKRAESDRERERGLVPGLHAQPMAQSRTAGAGQAANKAVLLMAAAAALAILALAALWWRSQSESPPQKSVVASQPPVPITIDTPVIPSPAITASSAVSVVAAAPDRLAPRAPPMAREAAMAPAPTQGSAIAPAQITALPTLATVTANTAPPPKPTPARNPSPKPARIDPAAPAQLPTRLSSNGSPAMIPATKYPPEIPVSPLSVAQSKEPINKLSELPADLRLALPKLVISGSTYSDTPAYRMLIINGQVFHEGEKIAADMVLQQVKPNLAVLEYKGQRYSMPY